MIVEVCENHTRRTSVKPFVYVDGHGIKFEYHYCAECAAGVVEDEPRWQRILGGFIWVQEPCDGKCGAGDEYHRRVAVAA